MKFRSSIIFASRLLFPRTGKKSNARKSLFGAFVCIGISLIPLVIVLTVSNGMIKGITERIIGLSSSHINCMVYPHSDFVRTPADFIEAADKISNIPGVKNAFPEINGIGLAVSSEGRGGASIRAVRNDIFEENEDFKKLFEVVDGKPDLSRKNYVVIGKKLADDLKLQSGNVLRLVTTRKTSSGKIVPKITPLKVSGIVSSGYQELDALWVFVSLETGFGMLSSSGNFVVGVETYDAFDRNLGQICSEVNYFLKDSGNAFRWDEINTSEYENFASTQQMLVFIMMLIVLVASVNISSALVMLVMERKKEIAIIKSLGGTSGGIAFSFLATGMATGVLGVAFGLPAGILCSVNFYRIIDCAEKFVNLMRNFFFRLFDPAYISAEEIHLLDPAFYLQTTEISIPLLQLMIISIGTIFLSLVVSAVPAIKAGKEKPIDTLRKI